MVEEVKRTKHFLFIVSLENSANFILLFCFFFAGGVLPDSLILRSEDASSGSEHTDPFEGNSSCTFKSCCFVYNSSVALGSAFVNMC